MAMVAQVANNAATAAAQRIGAALSDAQYFESNMIALEQIRRQLDSSSTKDKLDAMKRVIALISLGKDASTFFPEVVKNVAAPSLEVKKLVYLYLVHYAEFKQDLALLAINSFQRDLTDPNEHIRALSLRVLSSIRVKIILQVVIQAIEKSAKDSSSYVRKAAAYAICKVCSLDSSCKEVLMDQLGDLIADRSTSVIGAAIVAFDEIAPDNWELIHPHYRRMCKLLKDIDPWGQISVMQMLLRYVRANFSDPNIGLVDSTDKGATNSSEPEADFYADVPKGSVGIRRNSDITLLLTSTLPLFFSLNNSVVASAIAIYFHVGTPSEFVNHALKPLMRLVNLDDDGSQVVGLRLAAAVAVRYPSILISYISEFYVSTCHSAPVRDLRMQVLNTMCQMAGDKRGLGSKPQARKEVLRELQDYLFRTDRVLAAAGARAIGSLATAHPESTIVIVKLLSSVVRTTKDPIVLTESINVLRSLLQKHPETQTKALPQLIAMLLNSDKEDNRIGTVEEPAARASIVWLIGEFYDQVQEVSVEALRILAKGFADEAAAVKLQILNLSAKLLASHISNTTIPVLSEEIRLKLLEYLCRSAKFDVSYDVRDKARILHCLFLTDNALKLRAKACQALLSKPRVQNIVGGTHETFEVSTKGLQDGILLGSMAHVLGSKTLPGTLILTSWAQTDSDDSLRDEKEGALAMEREYVGISSSSFGHMPLESTTASSNVATNITNMVWKNVRPNSLPPDGFQRDSAGNIIGFGQPGKGVRGMPFSSLNRPSYAGIDVNNIDTEAFYNGEEGESSSEYETETDSEEEAEEEKSERVAETQELEKSSNKLKLDPASEKVNLVKKLTGLEDILAGITPQKTPQSNIAANRQEEPLLMGDSLPVQFRAVKTPKIVSVEASLLANLDNLNFDDESAKEFLESDTGNTDNTEKS